MSDKKVYLQDIELAQAADIPVLPELATVATSGNYNDLENKPLIYAENITPSTSHVGSTGRDPNVLYGLLNSINESGGDTEDFTSRLNEGQAVSLKQYIPTIEPGKIEPENCFSIWQIDDESEDILLFDTTDIIIKLDNGIYNFSDPNHESIQDITIGESYYADFSYTVGGETKSYYATRQDVDSYKLWGKLDHPNFATVATSGSYNDLSDKPECNGAFVATYEQTSYIDVKNAIDADKPIVINFSNNMNLIVPTYCTYVVNGNITMHGIFKGATDTNVSIITLTPQNAWSISLIALQPKLTSGTNIKTVNGNSLLGSGDLVVGGGTDLTVDAWVDPEQVSPTTIEATIESPTGLISFPGLANGNVSIDINFIDVVKEESVSFILPTFDYVVNNYYKKTEIYTKSEVDAAIQAALEPFLPPESLHPFFADTSSSKWAQLEYTTMTRMHFIRSFTSNGWANLVRNSAGTQDTMFANLFPAPLSSLESGATYELKIEANDITISNPENISINILNNTTNNQLITLSGVQESVLLSDLAQTGSTVIQMALNGTLSNPRLLSIQVKDSGSDTTDGEFNLRLSLTKAS